MTRAFLILFLFVIAYCNVAAQSPRIGVEVSVRADARVKNDIESYVRRELRALNDIDLYSTKPRFEIQLVAINPSDIVAISVVVIEIKDFTSELTVNLTNKNLPAKSKDLLVKN